MKAIFIDPVNQTVNEVNISTSDDIARIVRGHIAIAVTHDNGDSLYVNDDGIGEFEDAMLGKDEAFRAYLFDVQAHQRFAGYGLIVGENDDGEMAPALTEVDDIRRIVSFYVPRASMANGPKH
jgi:hypothetical protein